MIKDFSEFEAIIGYVFDDKSLLKQALSHSSYMNEVGLDRIFSNERLEFLGDAVLELVTSEYLYNGIPNRPEGEMTRLRASLVCESSLALDASEIHLGEFLLLGKGEERDGGRFRPSVTSDAFEAVIGAIFIDGGFDKAKRFVERFVLNNIDKKHLFNDSKSHLQEVMQAKNGITPTYRIVQEHGPDHRKLFNAQVLLGDVVIGEGNGTSKKAAEQQAAYDALIKEEGGKANVSEKY